MRKIFHALFILLISTVYASADASNEDTGQIDLSNAAVINKTADKESVAVNVLISEINKKTGILLKESEGDDSQPAIIINECDTTLAPEGFKIETIEKTVTITGADKRGTLYGVGQFLRTMHWEKNSLTFPADYSILTSPEYEYRGHQLGFRNTANSYDAWDENQFDEYIKELALFGTNAIEGIPFEPKQSPVMTVQIADMRIALGKICQKYNLEYWVWTPVEFDLNDTEKKEALLNQWEDFYKKCPQLDSVFVPGGDPGKNHPSDMLPFLEQASKILRKYHPNAQLWISLQGFTKEKTDWFLDYMNKEQPEWLTGVIHGPQSPSISDTRMRLPKQYPINAYPDITHTVLCQFPVVWWDPAFALTEGREYTNPRPRFYKEIHTRFAPYTNGFVAYSDGVHDDANKILWNRLGWDSKLCQRNILIDYCKFFFGEKVAEEAADGILAMETNWEGSAALNGAIPDVWEKWEKLEKENPELQNNWRWRLHVMRAAYDQYVRTKLLFDTKQEKIAYSILNKSDKIGADKAMDEALQILEQKNNDIEFTELRKHIEKDGADLNRLIGLQMSVEKYKAKGFERCAVIDFLDRSLNDKYWLEDQFKEIKKLSDEKEKCQKLKELANWKEPVSGCTYDIVGSIGKNPHTMRGEVTYLNTEDIRNNIQTYRTNKWPNRSKYSWLSSFWPKGMVFEGLNPDKNYIARATGKGDLLLFIGGEEVKPEIYNKELGGIKEFKIPKDSYKTGKVTLDWQRPKIEDDWNWRQQSYLCEVWLIPES